MIKLFYSPFHSFIHKILVTIHEAGLWDDVDFVATYPFKNRQGEDQGDAYSIAAIAPLDKVPMIALEDGTCVYGSQAACECIDAMGTSGRRLFPPEGARRWDAITRLALADTMFETTVQMVMEGWHPPERQRMSLFEWIWPKIIRGLDTLEERAGRGFDGFDIGQASMLHAISYMDFRARFYDAKDPLYPDYDPFERRPNLTGWWHEATERPSVKAHWNIDFAGDDSPERCQAKVQEVLIAQGRA